MEIILKKEILDAIIEKNLQRLNLDPVRTEVVKRQINTNKIFNFFYNGISKDAIKELFDRMATLEINGLSDVPDAVTLLSTKDVMDAVFKALSVVKKTPIPKGDDELINLLIDLKTIENPEFFEKILSDTLEDAVNEKQ